MTKYEYRVTTSTYYHNVDDQEFLNEMGRDGWELVNVTIILDFVKYHWKRVLIDSVIDEYKDCQQINS